MFARGKRPVYVTSGELGRTNHFWNNYNKGYDQTYFIIIISQTLKANTADVMPLESKIM